MKDHPMDGDSALNVETLLKEEETRQRAAQEPGGLLWARLPGDAWRVYGEEARRRKRRRRLVWALGPGGALAAAAALWLVLWGHMPPVARPPAPALAVEPPSAADAAEVLDAPALERLARELSPYAFGGTAESEPPVLDDELAGAGPDVPPVDDLIEHMSEVELRRLAQSLRSG